MCVYIYIKVSYTSSLRPLTLVAQAYCDDMLYFRCSSLCTEFYTYKCVYTYAHTDIHTYLVIAMTCFTSGAAVYALNSIRVLAYADMLYFALLQVQQSMHRILYVWAIQHPGTVYPCLVCVCVSCCSSVAAVAASRAGCLV